MKVTKIESAPKLDQCCFSKLSVNSVPIPRNVMSMSLKH